MQHEPADDYIRRISTFIRNNEKNLAELNFIRRRPSRRQEASNASSAFYNPLSWFAPSDPLAPNSANPTPKSVVMSIDTHHLFYLLIRLEALNLPVGSLDVRVDCPSRPLSYINLFPDADRTETMSLSSFRSSLSAVSGLSLGVGWWGRPEPPTVDAELKYIYSSFTKLPALTLTAPGPKMIAEIANDPPNENAIPMDSFKNLKSLECSDIDPRSLLGWDNLAESLVSLKIKKSGIEDVSDIFIGAVLDDQARRQGSTSRKRVRRIPHGPERRTSFYSSQVPETVPEAEEPSSPSVDTTDPTPPSPPPPTQLSSRKWAYLRNLSLSGNDLTFFPSELIPYLTSITHLDLSSNLLNSVPEGLGGLHNLTSLNISDNMIESVLGIYLNLGSILTINLSRNRLESICGLERLHALERVDLRHNAIEESAEIGRLAPLPNIAQVWVEGNPFTEYEESYRVICFDFFWKEGKTIMLDGSPPGFYERRNLTVPPPEQMSSSRPVSAAYSPPTIAIGHSHSHPHSHPSSHPSSPPTEAIDKNVSPAASTSTSPHLGPVGAIGVSHSGKARRKKVKRIVDLDGDHGHASDDGASIKGSSHKRTPSNVSGGHGTGTGKSGHKPKSKSSSSSKSKAVAQKDRETSPPRSSASASVDHPSFGQFVSLLAMPGPGASLPGTEPSASTSASTSTKGANAAADQRPREFRPATLRKSRHIRSQTDMGPVDSGLTEESSLTPPPPPPPAEGTPPSPSALPSFTRRTSQTFSSARGRASARRARVTASVYEASNPTTIGEGEESAQVDEAEAFRRRIEALKNDMGDGWLKVFSQTQMKTPS